MDLERSTFEILPSVAPSINQTSLTASSLHYEPLTSNSDVALSQSHERYEKLKNDMWEDIFPVAVYIAPKQLKPNNVNDVSKRKYSKAKKHLHDSLPDLNKTDQKSFCKGLIGENVECISRLSHSVGDFIISEGKTEATTTHYVHLPLAETNEEPYEDVWTQIFPIKEQHGANQFPRECENSSETRKILFRNDPTENKVRNISVLFMNVPEPMMTQSKTKPTLIPESVDHISEALPRNPSHAVLGDFLITNNLDIFPNDFDNFDDDDQEMLIPTFRAEEKFEDIIGLSSPVENEYACISEFTNETTQSWVKKEKSKLPTRLYHALRNFQWDTFEPRSLVCGIFNYFRQTVSRRSCTVLAVAIAVVVLNIMSILLSLRAEKMAVNQRAYPKQPMYPSRLNASWFLDNSSLLGVIPGGGSINGMAVLKSQLFVIRNVSTDVNVYDTENFTLIRNITIPGPSDLYAIVAISRYDCLYISDGRVVYRYQLVDDVISNWSVGGDCYGLSLIPRPAVSNNLGRARGAQAYPTHNILVTQCNTLQMREYTEDGRLVREVNLERIRNYEKQRFEWNTYQFVVSHSWNRLEQPICVMDYNGDILRCYGGSQGSDVGLVKASIDLTEVSYNNVLVAGFPYRNQMQLVSATLTEVGNISIPGHTVNYPHLLHFNEYTRRLYIGEATDTGRVFAVTA